MDICRRVRVKRRSACSFGRIEIRSSSEDSQFIMFRNRSRLPLKRRILFATQPEEPVTTKRPWLLACPVLFVPAAPRTNGPFLSFPETEICAELRLVVSRLLSEVENNFSTVVLSPDFTSNDRASGYAVATSFISRTIGCDS